MLEMKKINFYIYFSISCFDTLDDFFFPFKKAWGNKFQLTFYVY